jgi:hypothetical protein
VVQYRINPLPPTTRPDLERRDLSIGEDWSPIAGNVENLQVQYGQGIDNQFRDEPLGPISGDPNTWVTQVRVTVSGRSMTANLEGSSPGAFDDGAHLRRAFTTTMSLRNQLYQALDLSLVPGSSGWN